MTAMTTPLANPVARPDPHAASLPQARDVAAFRAVFTGPLASLPQPVCGEPDDGGLYLTFRQLGDPTVQAMIQERFAPAYPDGDRRAVASMWSKWLFNALLPTVTGLLLTEGRGCTADDSSVGVVLSEAGYPQRFWIRETGDVTAPVAIPVGLAALARQRLSPVIDALSTVSGASRNVFWSNAGNTLEYVIGEMARHPAITPLMLEQGYAFLECRRLDDGQRNPLFRPVRYRAPAGETGSVERQRRVCCIRYLLPNLSYCSNCPLNCRRGNVAATDEGDVCRNTARRAGEGTV